MSAEAMGEVLAQPRIVLKGNGVLSDYVRCDTILPFFWLRPRRFFLEYSNISVTVVLQPLLPSSSIARRGLQGTCEGPLLWLSNNLPYRGQGKPNRLRRGSSVNDYFLGVPRLADPIGRRFSIR